MRLRHDCSSPTPSPRLRQARNTAAPGAALNALLSAVLVIALAACASFDYDTGDFTGTFEDEEGAAITLLSDGTGTLSGLDSQNRDRAGTWELVESGGRNFISFFYDEPDPEIGSAANAQIWFNSDDELYLLPDGPDSGNRHVFERVSDE